MRTRPWLAASLVLSGAMLAAEQHVSDTHPRLVFRPADNRGLGRTFDEVRALYRTDGFFRSTFEQALLACESSKNPAMTAACWIVSGEQRFAQTTAKPVFLPWVNWLVLRRSFAGVGGSGSSLATNRTFPSRV